MTEQELLEAIEAWRNSDEYKQIERVMEIHEQAERIYQQALAAMSPVRTYTTNNTRPVLARKGKEAVH